MNPRDKFKIASFSGGSPPSFASLTLWLKPRSAKILARSRSLHSFHRRIPNEFVQLQPEANRQSMRQNPFREMARIQPIPAARRVREYRRKNHLTNPRRQPVPGNEIAGEIIIAAAGNHEFNFVLFVQCAEVGHVESAAFAGIRAFHVDNLNDFLRQGTNKTLAAGFDQDGIAFGRQLFRERGSFLLQQRFAAGDFHKRDAIFAFTGQPANLREHFVQRVFCPAVKSVFGVAPDAAEVASGEAHENARHAGTGAFALDGFENFGDDHARTLTQNYDARSRPIRSGGGFRLPDGDAGNPGAIRRRRKLARSLIVDVTRQIFRRRIERIERRKLVEILVIKRSDDGPNHLLEIDEIVEQAGGIKFLAGKDDANLVIMAVEIFALALVIAQVVRGGKRLFDANFVHEPSP